MSTGMIGRKVGMTQVFQEDGRAISVTVLEVGPNVVVQKKAESGKDGYNALKLGFGEVHKFEKEGTEPRWRINSPRLGVFKAAGIEVPRKVVREFRLHNESDLDQYEVGAEITASDVFRAGSFVDVTGTSKGRGFTGVMKRHNFHGTRATHGTHEAFRHGGSIGASADPAKVFKGMKMPGQHGNARSTVQNLHVVEVIAENNLVLVKGGVPGPNGGIIYIKSAMKKRGAMKEI